MLVIATYTADTYEYNVCMCVSLCEPTNMFPPKFHKYPVGS